MILFDNNDPETIASLQHYAMSLTNLTLSGVEYDQQLFEDITVSFLEQFPEVVETDVPEGTPEPEPEGFGIFNTHTGNHSIYFTDQLFDSEKTAYKELKNFLSGKPHLDPHTFIIKPVYS